MYLCILGRQPALGTAELESRFGADALRPLTPDTIQLDSDQDAAVFNSVGGILKAAELLDTFNSSDWNKLQRHLQKSLPNLLKELPDGKVTLGLSVHGFTASNGQINAAALSLKKVIKQSGRSARIVPNNEPTLNTAQVLHNKLTNPTGIELILVKVGAQTYIARTVWVQDINAYRKRDQERPMRDARVGMLPPKLAQIILNLALNDDQFDDPDDITVLDPFCGTGVLLQEALLAGYNAFGTDLDSRMVDYSTRNLDWLQDTILRDAPQAKPRTRVSENSVLKPTVGDATTMQWRNRFDLIACETYLGRALSSMPDQETLQKIIKDCDTIHAKFLKNVARQTKPGFRMCIAVPAWSTKKGFKHMPVLDHLEELGYNQVSFEHAQARDLVYHRDNQIVARALVVLIRK